MARTRNIKPGFFTNDKLLECDPLARILFAGLWCHADREGRLEDRPKKFKIEILPADDCNVADLLAQLERNEFITRYVVGGISYIQVLSFHKHQKPHVNETASEIPAPTKTKVSRKKEVIENNLGSAKHDQGDTQSGLLPSTLSLTPNTPPSEEGPPAESDLEIALKAWNTLAGEIDLPLAQRLTKPRRTALAARLEECGGLLGWEAALEKVRSSSFLRGQNDRSWRADFDFVLQAKSFTKLMEGGYDRASGTSSNAGRGGISDEVGSAVAGALARKAARQRSNPGADGGAAAPGSSRDSADARAPVDGTDRGGSGSAARVGPGHGDGGEGSRGGGGCIPRGFENDPSRPASDGYSPRPDGTQVWQSAAAGGGDSLAGAGGHRPALSAEDAAREGGEVQGRASGTDALPGHDASAEGSGGQDHSRREDNVSLVGGIPTFLRRSA